MLDILRSSWISELEYVGLSADCLSGKVWKNVQLEKPGTKVMKIHAFGD